jgi:hypothetical protein
MTTNATEEFYAELHSELLAEYGADTEEPWVAQRLDRVMARLNAVRQDGIPLVAHCLRIPAFTAFTVPGRNVYVARQLLERLPTDECAAFVLGHEAAHHDLGHLEIFHSWLDVLPRGTLGLVVGSLVWKVSHRLYGPERESQADQYAVELCLDAGFDGALCLQAFDILEQESLHRGDIDGVFGPENLLDPTDPGQGSLAYQAQRWLWSRARRYLPLRERREITWAFYRRRLIERAGRSASRAARRSSESTKQS